MTLDELRAWVTHPRMHRDNVDLCTIWIVIGKHWPMLIRECRHPAALQELGEAIDLCCAVRLRSKRDPPHPCCDVLKSLGPDGLRKQSIDERITDTLTFLEAALNRFCTKVSAASRNLES